MSVRRDLASLILFTDNYDLIDGAQRLVKTYILNQSPSLQSDANPIILKTRLFSWTMNDAHPLIKGQDFSKTNVKKKLGR